MKAHLTHRDMCRANWSFQTTPEQIRTIAAIQPGFLTYLLSRRRRGIPVMGTEWAEQVR